MKGLCKPYRKGEIENLEIGIGKYNKLTLL